MVRLIRYGPSVCTGTTIDENAAAGQHLTDVFYDLCLLLEGEFGLGLASLTTDGCCHRERFV